MGYGLEIDMIKIAHDLDLLTSPYVFDVDQAKADELVADAHAFCPYSKAMRGEIDVEAVATVG